MKQQHQNQEIFNVNYSCEERNDGEKESENRVR
jgi:hypothetical protein